MEEAVGSRFTYKEVDLVVCDSVDRTHTAVKIAPRYTSPVVYVLDASRSVVVVRTSPPLCSLSLVEPPGPLCWPAACRGPH